MSDPKNDMLLAWLVLCAIATVGLLIFVNQRGRLWRWRDVAIALLLATVIAIAAIFIVSIWVLV